MTQQSVSVKSAEIIVSRLKEFLEADILSKLFASEQGLRDFKVIQNTVNTIQTQIDDANLINYVIGTNEIKVNFNDNHLFYTLTEIFKKYEGL